MEIQSNNIRRVKLHVFMVFPSIMNLFLQIMTLLIDNINKLKNYSESFTMNSHFPLKM